MENSVPAQVNSPTAFIRKELGSVQGQRRTPPGLASLAFFCLFLVIRQEFLFYYEKENGIKSQMVERMKSGPRTCVVAPAPRLPAFSADRTRTSTRTQLVKQTYSVNVHSQNSPNVRKWHLSEYNFPSAHQTSADPIIRCLLLC